MVDKIIGGKGFAPLGKTNRTGHAESAKKGDSAKRTDRVDFSSALQSATKAQATGATKETARADMIQALKGQIENGTYKPDLDKVASSLLPFILQDS